MNPTRTSRQTSGASTPSTERRPSRCRALFLAFCLLASSFILHPSSFAQGSRANPAASAPRTGPLTYDNFKLFRTRNVFDPDRRPVRAANSAPAPSSGRADFLAVTGTLLDGNKSYAFFSGSRADFNKVLSVGDKIANSTVREITPLTIVVERDGKRTTVNVGQTVPLDGKSAPGAAPVNFADAANGTPAPANPASPGNPATSTGPAAPANDNPGDGSSPGGAPPAAVAAPATGGKPPAANQEEILRRMMERRKQELK